MKYTAKVPVFNGEDTIERCIRSLIDQKHVVLNEDYYILVVDDGSTDRTSEILSQLPVDVIIYAGRYLCIKCNPCCLSF